MPYFTHSLGPLATLGIGYLAVALLPIALAVVSHVAVAVVGLLLGGFGPALFGTVAVTYRQVVTPPEMLGQTNAAFQLFATGTAPVGAAVGATVASAAGLPAAFALAALLCTVGASAVLELGRSRASLSTALGPTRPDVA